MKQTLLASAIALAFGLAAPAWANPTNDNRADTSGANTQTAQVNPSNTGTGAAQATENSDASVDNSSSTDSSTHTSTRLLKPN